MTQKFSSPVSNRSPLIFSITVAVRGGTPIVLTGATFVVGIRARGASRCALTGTTENGVVAVDGDGTAGTATVTFTRAQMTSLAPGDYEMGIYASIPTIPATDLKLWIGGLPVEDGITDP
jgi:hypothetical protein